MLIYRTVLMLLLGITPVVIVGCMSAHNIRPPDRSSQTSRPITIMTYNIRIGAGLAAFGRSPYKLKDEVDLHLKPVIEAIRSVDPDIVGLQEVLGGGVNQAAEIGEALNMNYAYVPHGLDRYGTWWGVAILSKFPILAVSRHEISSGRGNTRANLLADIDVFGKKVAFIIIHKDKDQTEGDALRTTMQRINEIKEPVVLIGDLNILPADRRHDILSERLLDSARIVDTQTSQFTRARGTYPGEERDRWGVRIDYILIDKKGFEVLNAGLIEEQYWEASDHLGYFTTVKIR